MRQSDLLQLVLQTVLLRRNRCGINVGNEERSGKWEEGEGKEEGGGEWKGRWFVPLRLV